MIFQNAPFSWKVLANGLRAKSRYFRPHRPWLVTPDEIPDAQNLDTWLEADGHRYQNGSTRTMIFGLPYLISYLSKFMSLQTGDVISTGTPPGVGFGLKPPVYLRAPRTAKPACSS